MSARRQRATLVVAGVLVGLVLTLAAATLGLSGGAAVAAGPEHGVSTALARAALEHASCGPRYAGGTMHAYVTRHGMSWTVRVTCSHR